MKLKILEVKVERKTDQDPDLSHLGTFTDDQSDNAIIRYGQHAGKTIGELGEEDELPVKSREYRYFLPTMTGEETGNPDSPKQDWQRMEAYESQQWEMIGIIAKAEIWNPVSQVTQVIRSGGLWGIESDSGADYLKEVASEELANLKTELLALGIGERAIERAFSKLD